MDYRQEFREKCKIERKNYESKILGDISKFKIETEDIIKKYWGNLIVKPNAIHVRITKSIN